MRWITRVLAILPLAVAACAPQAAGRPTSPPATAPPAANVSASPGATAAPISQPGVTPPAAAGPEVKIVEPPFRPQQEWTYAPAELSVKVGTQVVWTNTGAVAHTVTADDGTSFDSGNIDPKATFTLAPAVAGRFAYHCTFHPWVKASLVVTS